MFNKFQELHISSSLLILGSVFPYWWSAFAVFFFGYILGWLSGLQFFQQ